MDIPTQDGAAREGFVYIAGAYRSLKGANGGHDYNSYTDIDAHINIARWWAKQLAESNIPMFCPHLNSAHFEVIAPSVQPDYWYRMDLVILSHASAIFMIPNWEVSKGATIELACATKWGIPDYYAQGTPGSRGLADLANEWASRRDRAKMVSVRGV